MEALFGLLFVAVVFWWLARRKKRQAPKVLSSSQAKAPKAEVRTPPIYTRPRPVQEPARAQRTSMRFAEPGRVDELFSYGGPPSGKSYIHDGSFAVIDVETTGFHQAKAIASSNWQLPA